MSDNTPIQGVRGRARTTRRIWLFRLLAAVVIPCPMLLLVELFLRLIGYGFPAEAIIRCQVDGHRAYCDNAKFAWQFFPRSIAREFDPFVFPADRTENTYRVFIIGASAAQGTPAGEYCFGRVLNVMLRDKYPGVDFQIITAAMPAINSHAALNIAQDCADHDADLLIVYLGNNEVVGPYGAGTVFAPLSDNLSFIRARLALKSTRLGQLLRRPFDPDPAQQQAQIVWQGLAMFLEKQVRAESDPLQAVYAHFQRNLSDIIRTAKKNDIPIIVSSVATNLKDSPPFASLHRHDLTAAQEAEWDGLYRQGAALEDTHEYGEAVAFYLQATRIDETFADLHFRMGRCYGHLEEYDKARSAYVRAREFDALRFRADKRINEIIRNVAAGNESDGIGFVDAVDIFAAQSPNSIPGRELFYEHVHMNFAGTYLLARAMFEKIETLLPERVRKRMNSEAPPLSETQCAERLAYTDWDRRNLTKEVLNVFIKKPPFTNQLYHHQRVERMEQQLQELEEHLDQESLETAQEQYLQAIERSPQDWWLHWKYALLLTTDLNDVRTGAEHYRVVTELTPKSYSAYATYGLALSALGEHEAAISNSLAALRLNPICADAYHLLGISYEQTGRPEKAMECYSSQAELRPDHAHAYNNMAVLLDQQQRIRQAEEVYRKGLVFSPDDVPLRYNLALLLARQGRFEEAMTEIHAALESQPNSIELRSLSDKVQRASIQLKR